MSNNIIPNDKYDETIANNSESVTEVKWQGITLIVKKRLSLDEMMTFVSDVVLSCFATDTNEYLPEIKDFSIRCSILESYAGFVLPESLSDKYETVYSSDIVSTIIHCVDQGQFNAMLEAIDNKIDYKSQSNIEALNKRMNEVIDGLSTLEHNLSSIFSDIDSDTISKLASAIIDGNFDKNRLVKAFSEEKNAEKKTISISKRTK